MNINDTSSLMTYINERLIRYVTYMNTIGFKQGSSEWLKNRIYSIGCSELYDAVGTEVKKRKVVDTKLGKGPNLSYIIPVIWGNVFESSTRLVSELFLGTKIFTLNGSIKHKNNVVTCSPDGIGIVRLPLDAAIRLTTKNIEDYYTVKKDIFRFKSDKLIESAITVEFGKSSLNNWSPPTSDSDVEFVALYEFKSRRGKPITHDKIQPDHLYQVLGGIEVMNVVYNVGVYVESEFDTGDFNPIGVVVNDNHRQQRGNAYFGSCKYVTLTDRMNIVMQKLDLNELKGKRITEDYTVIDGPYIFSYGDKVIFDDNGFFELYPELKSIPKPTEVIMLNVYFKQINDLLDRLPNKPTFYETYQLKQLSIKYVSGLKGFVDLLESRCKEVLKTVSENKM